MTRLEQLCSLMGYQGGTIHDINREVNILLNKCSARLDANILDLNDDDFSLLCEIISNVKKV